MDEVFKMVNPEIIIEIEENINHDKSLKNASRFDMTKIDSDIIDEINTHIDQAVVFDLSEKFTLYDDIIAYIKRLGVKDYLRRNGEVKEATFYQRAYIDKSTWSDIKWDKINPSKKTILKLIIALELNEKESEEMLRKCKERFEYDNIQDQIILAIIKIRTKRKLEIEEVKDILFEYQEMYKEINPFDCIYETPEMIAERKTEKN